MAETTVEKLATEVGKSVDRLIEQFSQAGRNGLHGEKSIGLGLHISQKIMHQHGGELLQLERPGGGAIARLQLPVGNADTGAAAAATP